MDLSEFFTWHTRVAVAFSGGVDSAFLLYAAVRSGCDVRAYFMKTPFQPEFELADAMKLADFLCVPLTVVTHDILSNSVVAANLPDRCYYCKKLIFTMLKKHAFDDGYSVLCDGTNADDREDERPGMRVLRELGVLSPLSVAGLTKSEIRRLSREAGLFTHDKPSYACLATRIPEYHIITHKLLAVIEQAEDKLFELGFSDLRVRFLPPCNALVELTEEQMMDAVNKRGEILAALERDFDRVSLNLKAR